MQNDPTTPPHQAVRPATPCWLLRDTESTQWVASSHGSVDDVRREDGDVPALAIDNDTGGGVVARLRKSFDKIAWDDLEAQYHEIGHDRFVQLLTERVCKDLGVTP